MHWHLRLVRRLSGERGARRFFGLRKHRDPIKLQVDRRCGLGRVPAYRGFKPGNSMI